MSTRTERFQLSVRSPQPDRLTHTGAKNRRPPSRGGDELRSNSPYTFALALDTENNFRCQSGELSPLSLRVKLFAYGPLIRFERLFV